MIRHILSLGLLLASVSCVSTANDNAPKEPPQITEDMDLKEAVDAASEFGGKTFESVKNMITKRKEWPAAGKLAGQEMLRRLNDSEHERLMNYAYLFFASGQTAGEDFVEKFLKADNETSLRIGWTLATRYSSPKMATMLERILTNAIEQGQEQRHLIPEMARAVAVNNIKSVYTLVREGLMLTGSDDFAKAMVEFDGKLASKDFGFYLAKATLDDLRQLNQQTVNMYTCLVIFRHLLSEPLALSHPHFDALFLYAVSRNQMLAEMANLVIERQMAKFRSALALMLARQKMEVQIAFIEANRRTPSPQVGLFLRELKRITAHKEVVEEIDTVRR